MRNIDVGTGAPAKHKKRKAVQTGIEQRKEKKKKVKKEQDPSKNVQKKRKRSGKAQEKPSKKAKRSGAQMQEAVPRDSKKANADNQISKLISQCCVKQKRNRGTPLFGLTDH